MSQLKRELPSFDALVELAARDPDGLEQLRHAMIEDIITRASHTQRRRLEGLQFTIDMERRRAKNPVQSCMRMTQLMYDRVSELQDSLNDLVNTTAYLAPSEKDAPEAEVHTAREKYNAKVVPLFPNPREDERDDS